MAPEGSANLVSEQVEGSAEIDHPRLSRVESELPTLHSTTLAMASKMEEMYINRPPATTRDRPSTSTEGHPQFNSQGLVTNSQVHDCDTTVNDDFFLLPNITRWKLLNMMVVMILFLGLLDVINCLLTIEFLISFLQN